MENSTSLFSEKVLMNKDQEVGIIQNGYVRLYKGMEHLAPLCFSWSNWPVSLWADVRVVDSNRVSSRLIKKLSRIRQPDNLNTLYTNHGVSLVDTYWIRDSHEDITWDEVKPNSDKLFEIALTSQGFNSCYYNSEVDRTPELTNVGSFDKAWKLTSDGWVLVKSGNPNQNLSEVLVSRVGKLFEMDMLIYDLSEDNSYTISQDFTKGIWCFEPMSYIVGEDEDYARSYKILEKFSHDIAKKYLDLLVLDAIVVNPDRHTNNYGLLRDQYGNIVDLAPNYDNNLAFIATGIPERLTTLMISDVVQFLKDLNISYSLKHVRYGDIYEVCSRVSQRFNQDPSKLTDLLWANCTTLLNSI